MIIDHIGVAVTDFERAKEFYGEALAPLGISLVSEFDRWAGFGRDGKPEFWFGEADQSQRPMHIAFGAHTRSAVDLFFSAALAAGGKDNGAPGIRAIYHPNYYGAFVIDPDGHNIEAVCHSPE
jgi:catechol 2,3-dioxygenase-like lactoylglutathione lyase family enzyme